MQGAGDDSFPGGGFEDNIRDDILQSGNGVLIAGGIGVADFRGDELRSCDYVVKVDMDLASIAVRIAASIEQEATGGESVVYKFHIKHLK